MQDYLQIVTEICRFAQMLLLDPRMELAQEPLVKISGTCSFDHAHFYAWLKIPIMDCEGRRDFSDLAK
jgi:hypothetical protein